MLKYYNWLRGIYIVAFGVSLMLFSATRSSAQTGLKFDSAQIVRTTSPGISGGGARTVEAWIKTANQGTVQMVICDWGSGVAGGRFTLNLINGHFLRIEVNGSGMTGTTALNDNIWHHVGVVYDPTASNKFTLLIDNFVEAAGNIATTVNTTTITPVRLGARIDTTNFFKGRMDEVRIYNYARTQTQFMADTLAYCSAQPGLVAYYKLDEGTPGANNTANTVVLDYSGNGYNGVLKNFTLTAGSASNWDTGRVAATPTPVPALALTALPAGAVCAGTSVTFTASPTFGGASPAYQWKVNSVVVGTNSSTYTYTPVNGDIVSCAMTSNYPCASTTPVTQSMTMTVNPLPAAPTVISPVTYCLGATATALTATGINLQWYTVSSGGTASASITPSTATVGSTPYYVSQSSVAGCEGPRASITVTVNPLPAAPVVVSPVNLCVGGTSSALTATGTNLLWYTSAVGGSGTTGAPTPGTGAVGTTTYYVSQTATGCESPRASIAVIVNALPTVSVTPATATSVCLGSGVVLTGNGASTYAWSPSSSLNASTGTSVTASPTTPTTYTVTGTDIHGCVNTATKLVSVNALPTVSITPATAITFCAGNSAVLTGNGATTYSWSPATGLSATTGATVTATPASTILYTVTGTGANGCSNTATKLITVNGLPATTVSPSPLAPVCTGSTITLTGTPATGGFTYLWTISGSPAPGTNNAANYTTGTAGTYTLTVANSTTGCVKAASTTVIVNPVPGISVTPAAATICFGQNTSLTASGGVSYSWSPAAGLTPATGATVSASPGSTTTYTVTGTNSSGCSNTAAVVITVNPLPPVTITPGGLTIACDGTPVVLTASGAATYSWSPSAGLSSATGAVVTASPSTTMIYTVTGTDANGCINTANKAVVLYAKPAAEITPSGNINICEGDTATLNVTVSSPGVYAWHINGATIPGATSSTLKTTAAGSYTVNVTDNNGCNSTTATPTVVSVLPRPVPVITATGTLMSVAGSFATYQWYFNGQIIPGATANTYVATHEGFYTVVVADISTQCTGTSQAYHMTGLGVAGTALANNIKLYPNPATAVVHIDAPVTVAVAVSSMEGKLMLYKKGATQIDISGWADGVYTVIITDESGRYIKNEKIVKTSK